MYCRPRSRKKNAKIVKIIAFCIKQIQNSMKIYKMLQKAIKVVSMWNFLKSKEYERSCDGNTRKWALKPNLKLFREQIFMTLLVSKMWFIVRLFVIYLKLSK